MLTTKTVPSFKPSRYQELILAHAKSNLEVIRPYVRNHEIHFSVLDCHVPNIQVKASAGSGKTTLLAEIFRMHYEMGFPLSSVQVLSFVRQNIQDITNKFKDIVEPEDRKLIEKQISTFNGFGYRSLIAAYDKWNKLYPDNQCSTLHIHQENKYRYIAERLIYKYQYNEQLCSLSSLISFVDKLREQIILRNITVVDLKNLAYNFKIRHNINSDAEWEDTLNIVVRTLYEGIKQSNPAFTSSPTADFLDQCLVPFALSEGSQKPQYFAHFREALADWKANNVLLLVDEVQDINPVLLEMVRLMESPHSTVVVVGDNGQNIYKWRGSQDSGMDNLARDIQAKSYKLPISYRMAKNHIQFIKAVHPDREIEHFHESNGRIILIDKLNTEKPDDYLDKLKPYLDNDLPKLFLARKKNSIVQFALALIAEGYIVNVKGMVTTAKKYAKQVCGHYRKGQEIQFPTANPASMFDWIEAWRSNKVKVMQDNNVPKSQINEINEWALCLWLLFVGLDEADKDSLPTSFEEWEDRISILSTRKKKGVIQINTIHSSKGAEAPIVVFIDPASCPITWKNQSQEDLTQEHNTLFVAISRAKLTDHPDSGTLILLTEGDLSMQKGWLSVASVYGEWI